MRCIYCNAENDLTSSDIISYAITGAKVTRSFVCHRHNAYTNDNYEKKFIADLNEYRNALGLSTRDGKPIQYSADIIVSGVRIHDVILSDRVSLYNPKGVVNGTDGSGQKVLLAPKEKFNKMKKGAFSPLDMSDVSVCHTISYSDFSSEEAKHSVAKIAYEWFCFINNINEYNAERYQNIVNYITGVDDGFNPVSVVVDRMYYSSIDKMQDIGTNSLFEYIDEDGYKYVIFDLWKTLAYRIKICKSQANETQSCLLKLFSYHLDGSKKETTFGIHSPSGKFSISSLQLDQISQECWCFFANRMVQIFNVSVFSIFNIKKQVDIIGEKLARYIVNADVAKLLDYEDDRIAATLYLISKIEQYSEKYDQFDGFNSFLASVLDADGDTVKWSQEDKQEYLRTIMGLHDKGALAGCISKWIAAFNVVFDKEQKRNTNGDT